MKLVMFLFSFGLVLTSGLMAGESEKGQNFVFICHKGFYNSRAEIMRSYRAQLDVPHVTDNEQLQPEMLKLLKMSKAQYDRMWTRFFFRRALNKPILKENDAAVIEYVANTPDSIGYISAPPTDPRVEVCKGADE